MRRIFYFLLLLAFASMLQAGEKAGFKVFISVDMEGISGVVHGEHTSPESREYGQARKWMSDDVNAAIMGLLEAGATEIVVNDSHGSMRNILPGDLHPKGILISGSPKPLSMMQGIDGSYDACLFVGYHAKAGTASAILDHTISGSSIRSIKINSTELPELGINAAIAGYFNVPVIMLSGDTEACKQAKAIIGSDVVTVEVKEGIGRYAAKLVPFEEARKRIKEGAKEALLKMDKIMPFVLKAPFLFEVEFQNSGQAEMPSLLAQVKRTGARSISFSVNDFLEGFKLMRALIALASS